MEIRMGKLPTLWNEKAKSITFCVTEDCNLACKYCYMTGKNNKSKMSFDVARKAIDYILLNREEFDNEAVIWEFIGGEPTLEIELIDKICEYIKYKMFSLNHPWFENYRFNISTNGILYDTQNVQRYIMKNKSHLNIGISVDGNKVKHDLQRVWPDGKGSYDDVVKNVSLWQRQFPGAVTKSTFAHEDLPYLKDSIISLWNLGISIIAANVVFENVWHEGDDEIFENQLIDLADYVIENKLWRDYSVRFFDPSIGFPLSQEAINRNWCGTGKMLAIDTLGNLYPCIRFYDISLSNRKGYMIGDISSGIDKNKQRPFLSLNTKMISSKECLNCDVASGCAWCTGCNYDFADTDTIYQRVIFNCKMHKANVRANRYFWDKFEKVTKLKSPRRNEKLRNEKIIDKYLYFITENIKFNQLISSKDKTNKVMDKEVIDEGFKFATLNGFTPVLLKGKKAILADIYINPNESEGSYIDNELNHHFSNTCMYSGNSHDKLVAIVNVNNIQELYKNVIILLDNANRVDVIIEDIENWNDIHIKQYDLQLEKLAEYLVDSFKQGNKREINVLTDIFNLTNMENCLCGNSDFTLAPNGKIYICPAFYFDNPDSFVGTLEDGIELKNKHLCELENSPICAICDVYHCKRCKFLNKKLTGEINIPSMNQCVVSHTERNRARILQKALLETQSISPKNGLAEINYIDPLEKLSNKWRDNQ